MTIDLVPDVTSNGASRLATVDAFALGVLAGLMVACALVIVARQILRREMRARHARTADELASEMGLQRAPGETTEALMDRLMIQAGWPEEVVRTWNNAWRVALR